MDPLTLGAAAYGGGALVNALGSFFGGQSQAEAMARANAQNAALTRESWARDDTAVQRRANDMIAAGINPVMAAGSAATTSSPIPMQSEGAGGMGAALQSAGQSIMGAPNAYQMFKRSAAATLAAEAAARQQNAAARITEHDATEVENNRDPRNKGVIDQLLSGMPKLIKAMREGSSSVSDLVNGDPSKIKAQTEPMENRRFRDIARRMNDEKLYKTVTPDDRKFYQEMMYRVERRRER